MESVKKITNFITTVIVIAIVLVALVLVGARVFGLKVYTVLSGSMEPNYHVGSIVYVKGIDPGELKKGDVISFMLDENTVATHRITEVTPDKEEPGVYRYTTKGDANKDEDANKVHSNNVIGKVVATIPYAGYVSDFVRRPPGMYYAIAACILLILLVFLPGMIFPDEKEKKKSLKEGEDNTPTGNEK